MAAIARWLIVMIFDHNGPSGILNVKGMPVLSVDYLPAAYSYLLFQEGKVSG